MALKEVRVLKKASIDGVDYKPDQVISVNEALALSLIKSGTVDDGAAAVKYCVGKGAKVIKHQPVNVKQAQSKV